MKKIAIACDHIVTDIKNEIGKYLEASGYDVIDCGTYDNNRTHYPIFGHKAATLVAENKVDLGVVLCGTGVGISNAANKTKGIRAALVRDIVSAKQAKEEFNANIIAVGGRITGMGIIIEIIDTFLSTKYIKTSIKDKRIKSINELIKNSNYQEDLFDMQCQKWDDGYYKD